MHSVFATLSSPLFTDYDTKLCNDDRCGSSVAFASRASGTLAALVCLGKVYFLRSETNQLSLAVAVIWYRLQVPWISPPNSPDSRGKKTLASSCSDVYVCRGRAVHVGRPDLYRTVECWRVVVVCTTIVGRDGSDVQTSDE